MLRLILVALALGGCAEAPASPSSSSDVGGKADGVVHELGGDRPARLFVPPQDDGTLRPLVLLLHGITQSGALIDEYFRASEHAAREGYFLLAPDGTEGALTGNRFWNAVDDCCDFGESGVDDAGYLRGLIEEAIATESIDPARVFVLGHSNGGYMAHRMACDSADLIAGIATLAGAQWTDESQCRPTRPVSVLQIHATSDGVVAFTEGERAVDLWSRLNECEAPIDGPRLDIMTQAEGDEAATSTRACKDGTEVAFYRLETGPEEDSISDRFHGGELTDEFMPTVYGWLTAQAR